jgi:tetratricopeptide (TPR) repeat protein
MRRGHLSDQLATWRAGLTAAGKLGQPTTQALARRWLGFACANAGRHAEALDHLHHAITLADHAGDISGLGHGHGLLARVWELRGNHRQALEHATRSLQLWSVPAFMDDEAHATPGARPLSCSRPSTAPPTPPASGNN